MIDADVGAATVVSLAVFAIDAVEVGLDPVGALVLVEVEAARFRIVGQFGYAQPDLLSAGGCVVDDEVGNGRIGGAGRSWH